MAEVISLLALQFVCFDSSRISVIWDNKDFTRVKKDTEIFALNTIAEPATLAGYCTARAHIASACRNFVVFAADLGDEGDLPDAISNVLQRFIL
ncbi:MAG: hypothetical protein ALECFALPRED_009779 [Alectoria fallacina]|uniref:Uncharacterized protein n=1 Tax=Alectoria fallacina TaxID=1903189 RepID=A0A8H3J8B1_9LECA|nr:MAG: hypothetical protein ALECFALPRED_009779 [Alectoria fallacina]